MGSARLGYAADAVLLMKPMEGNDLGHHYDQVVGDEEKFKEELAKEGISPLIISLAKGRDSMVRGSWPAEFHFNESRITERVLKRPDRGPVSGAGLPGNVSRGPRPAAARIAARSGMDVSLDDDLDDGLADE